jgi:molybdate transport system substrate-binding protein
MKQPTAAQVEPAPLTISAATSLKDAMEQIKTLYIAGHPDVTIDLNFGSSGQLMQQIEQGAPVDIFISAGKPQMDQLEKKGLIVDSTRQDILSNDLVLVISANETNINDCQDLLKSEASKVAIGDVKTVPAGKYAQETMNKLGIWAQLEPKLVMGSDVKQVLAFVASGNASAGFVFRSDAVVSEKVKVAAVIDKKLHTAIVYPAAIINSTHEQTQAEDFIKFLSHPSVQEIFTKHGFKPMN